MVGRIGPVEQRGDGRQEIIGDGAADAAVGEFDDVILFAARYGATLDDASVDTEVAKLVDNERNTLAPGILQQVPDQACLAGTEEAGDDGGGDAFS